MSSERYREEMRLRRIIAEGVFARLDRLAWKEARLRGLEKVDCQGYIAGLAHNILKAIKKIEALRETGIEGKTQMGKAITSLRQALLSRLPSFSPLTFDLRAGVTIHG